MNEVCQGDILHLENMKFMILILSKDFFNRSGLTIACPVMEKAAPDALHIPVETGKIKGTAMLEQLKSLDLRSRHYLKKGHISFEQIQEISDAVQSIFDYYPFSLQQN